MVVSGDASPQSGTRARTRLAILDAAVAVLARDQTAPLADIADAAGVSRTTLHRHFTDRAELLTAAVTDSNQAIARAVLIADLASGEPIEALRRLVAALVEVADRILFLFHSYADDTSDDEPDGGNATEGDQAIIDLIRRGQERDQFTTDLDPKWIENALWSLVFAGCGDVASGTTPRTTIASNIMRIIEGGISVQN